MSKMQDAIRKIKHRTPGGENKPAPQSNVASGVFGQVVDELDETGVRIQSDDGGLIEINRDMLRDEGYLAPLDQARFLAEQYRILKRPLLDNALGRSAHVGDDANLIMVTSALPGDGKTFNCINLALSMAIEKDVSVLLVDADVAKPHISQLFGVDGQSGLTDLLKDNSVQIGNFVMRTDVLGLSVLPAGLPDEHATELLASRRMARVIHELSKSYSDRIVIFDSPPLLVTSEARVLASQMGQVAMVVCAGTTPQKAVLEAIENLDETKPINLILNQSAGGQGAGAYGSYHYGYGASSR